MHKILMIGMCPEPSFGEVLNNDDYVVMQYTGLKDKNGNEIYERDIVISRTGMKRKVVFEYYGFCLDNGFLALSISKFNSYDELEIIGNIYENPNLIEIE